MRRGTFGRKGFNWKAGQPGCAIFASASAID
ncbi:hypothetical protein J2W32_000773 [Variovorax boronicumulans]|nr:hypothetical protein [Variovorax boronicumulans]MDQ0051737.1 hypothetical protein [Variovorax boronicumulans]MDQ0072924.1 hypothetical protein [Variovorax boronicumulans]MDQ0605893.1 hypothetical protein [Variovorax sp. W1I1]